tara:strand:- start:1398 stop:2225 length:828 start_codon:yes stop_codon:yes gene_type:complete
MPKTFNERLRNGEKLYGTLIVSTAPQWAENFSKLGLDFVFIDTEHIAIGRNTLSWMCQTYRALNLNPIVRILRPDPFLASRTLDGGACGIIAPYVESVEEALDLVGAVKLHPVKGKKLQSILGGAETPSEELTGYLEKKSANRTLILNIESVEAIKNLDEILAIDGVDGVLIGPHDLSCSLEQPENYYNGSFDQAVREIIQKARDKGKGAGIHFAMGAGKIDLELEWIKAGANFILHSADIIAAIDALRTEFSILKSRPYPSGAELSSSEESINI